ncbi:MAG: malectin domain-containing carbohydrate-binding protein [Terracidiphilus sp.]
MAAESQISAGLDAQRAELEAVLQSKYFTRAPTLANLLSYLCEKLFAGEAHQIKEYSVGVEVFHRGPSFDQDSDSIVRVEANRLRKRLAEYYAEEGASHRLRIVIPLGQYVPDFESVTPVAEESEAAEQVAPGAGSTGIGSAAQTLAERWGRRPSSRTRWMVAVIALMLLIPSLVLLYLEKRAAPAAANQPAAQTAESQVGPPTGEEIRILAGSSRSFVDHAGKLWNADAWFAGGTAVKNTVVQIWRTQNPDFYRTSRQGNFSYAIPLKNGLYELHLHFAETVYGPDAAEAGGEGSRILSVHANGKTLLNRFDIVADAGANRTADVKVFTDISPAADGLLHLEFAGEDGKQALLSAIEILPGFKGHMRPVRVLPRQMPYYSNDSHWWSPDNYFEGGQMAAYAAPVNGTDDPELYETERWGNFTYAIPVSPGKYTVTLYFAARHGEWDQSSSPDGDKVPVAHIFNVFSNGSTLLNNFNLAFEARRTDVVIRKAPGLEPNAQGKLLLSFVPVQGYATVSGIEVLPQ